MTTDKTTELNLHQKLLKITEEIGKIEKTGRNNQQGYSFIEQSKVMAELRPQLVKWGVIIIPETIDRRVERYDVTRSNGKAGADIHVNVTSRYTVVNADKPDERFVCDWNAGEAIDSGDKATNKATTASQKTYLMKLFNISDKDDADADSPEAAPGSSRTFNRDMKTLEGPASPKQKALIRDKLMQQGIAPEEMKGYLIEQFGVTDTENMTKQDASMVIESLIGGNHA